MNEKIKILFLCTGNSCRSQMAEGLCRELKGDIFDVYSAGTAPKRTDPRAIEVMAEIGIDISLNRSKNVNELMNVGFDWVITVCGHANENCPFFPGKTEVKHVGFEDPPLLAENAESEEEALSHYKRVRDEIKVYIETLPNSLK